MVQLKVRMLLCDTGNKRRKSKYMSSLASVWLDDKVLSYNLAQGFYGCASSHPAGKPSALESLQPFGLAQLDGRELRS